jgi:hypothetical protein
MTTRSTKFTMGTTQAVAPAGAAPDEREHFVAAPVMTSHEEPFDRLTFAIPRRLRLQFNQEAATRDVKKQDLLREIFEFYFAKKSS